MMIPVYAGIFTVIVQLFLPVLSIPVLKYSKMPTTYRIFSLSQGIQNLQMAASQGGKLATPPLSVGELQLLYGIINGAQIASVCLILLAVISSAAVLLRKQKAVVCVRIFSGFQATCMIALCFGILLSNMALNQRLGRSNQFLNLSIHSYIQVTSWVYGQLLIALAIMFLAKKLMDTSQEKGPQVYISRSQKTDSHIGKRTRFSILIICLLIPFCIFFGIFFLNDRSNVFIGLCIVCLAMIPFAMVFEDRQPQARELLLIAVMSGIAVAGRVAFFMIPQFKPVTAVVIIAGVGLGAEAGFLTGAVSGFVSNFFFGQGPWTPWQMFAFGIIGFLAGIIFRTKKPLLTRRQEQLKKLAMSIYGFLATLLIYGLIMDFSSALTFSQQFSWPILVGKILSGLPFNLIHACSTVIFLYFLALPMERKLDRIRKKYGILQV